MCVVCLCVCVVQFMSGHYSVFFYLVGAGTVDSKSDGVTSDIMPTLDAAFMMNVCDSR